MRILAVRPDRLGLLLALRRPELVSAVPFHYPLHHVHGFCERGGRRALQLEKQVVSDVVFPHGVSRSHGHAHERCVNELDAL